MPASSFDPAVLLEVLTQEYTPDELVRELNGIHNQLADYMLMDEGMGGPQAVNRLHLVRRLRDSIMAGAGYFDFNNS